MWSVWLRSRKDPARIEAATAKEEDDNLILRDSKGEVVATFPLAEVQGRSVDSGEADFAIIPANRGFR
jgi:hypothetical protein